MRHGNLRRLFDRIVRLSAPLPLVFVGMACAGKDTSGKDNCAIIPCPAPGFDPVACRCRPPITFDSGVVVDAADSSATDDAADSSATESSDASSDAAATLDPCGDDGGPPRGGIFCHAACVFAQPDLVPSDNDGGFTGQACADVCGSGFLGGLARCELVQTGAAQDIVRCHPDCTGRRPAGLVENDACGVARGELGEYFAQMAYYEAASVDAFRVMAGELRRYRAPSRLVRAAGRAARDEVRHARLARGLARRYRASAAAPVVAAVAPRSLEAIALENAVEGCVRETWGALVAVHQSRRARDPQVRAVMARVARDETAHAELSWRIDAWLHGRLSRAERQLVADAKQAAFQRVAAESEHPPASALCEVGVPSAERAIAMLRDLQRALGV